MLKFLQSVRNGLAGLVQVTRSEMNMRYHLLAMVLVIACGVFFQINPTEWALVAGCIGMMLAAESFNTALERLGDRINSEHDPQIGHAKDAAAGAVLVLSVTSAVIGLIVFLPKVLALFPWTSQ